MTSTGFYFKDGKNITVQNCRSIGFDRGFVLDGCSDVDMAGNMALTRGFFTNISDEINAERLDEKTKMALVEIVSKVSEITPRTARNRTAQVVEDINNTIEAFIKNGVNIIFMEKVRQNLISAINVVSKQ